MSVSDFLGKEDPIYADHLERAKRIKIEPGLYEQDISSIIKVRISNVLYF